MNKQKLVGTGMLKWEIMSEQLLLLFRLAIKHECCGPNWTIYCRPSNKHLIMSKKALLHSGHHGAGTFIVLTFFSLPLSITMGTNVNEQLIHHIIDHTKSSLVKKYNWTQDGKMYWIATTVDQNLHFLTYLAIVLLA